jgi:hypothetical protein
MDFKIGIALPNGRQVNLHTVRDPFGAACIGAVAHDAGKTGRRPRQITMEQARYTLRRCFAFWNTLPERLQTDNQTGLTPVRQSNDFPTVFTLWLVGLGVEHVFIRRRPALGLSVEDLTGSGSPKTSLAPQQLPLPLLEFHVQKG